MLRILDRVIEALCATSMVVIVVSLFLGVIFRYVINRPLGWPEEVARMALVWMTFLGSYLAFRRGAHIHVDVFVSKLSHRARLGIALAGNLLMALSIALLIREGVVYATTFFYDPSPYLRFPIGLQYFALPIGGIGWLLALAVRTRQDLKGAPPEPQPTDTAALALDSE